MPRGLRADIERLLGTVDQIMERTVVVLRPDQTLGDAIRELERARVSGGPVMEGDRIVGMVSLSDLFEAAGVASRQASTSGPWHRYEHLVAAAGGTVAEAMRLPMVTLPAGSTIAAAAEAMRNHGVNRVPIVDDAGRLIGIVARDDVVAAVADAAKKTRAEEASCSG